jgi:hypothetical protein
METTQGQLAQGSNGKSGEDQNDLGPLAQYPSKRSREDIHSNPHAKGGRPPARLREPFPPILLECVLVVVLRCSTCAADRRTIGVSREKFPL